MKAAISYIFVLLCAVMYMILFDTVAGSIMVMFLFFALAVSLVFTALARKKITFELISTDDTVKKGDDISLKIRAIKKIFIPTPFISVTVETSDHFAVPEYTEYKFSMSSKNEMTIGISLRGLICGKGKVVLHNMIVTDYLGIFKFKITESQIISQDIYIRPDIYDIDDNKKIFQNISSFMYDNDDDDESSQVTMGGTAVPGYEYRDYIPGDSLKRINWKLSSKRRKLLVRKDETSSLNIPDIYLDTTQTDFKCSPHQQLLYQEMIIEFSVSMLLMCVKMGIECTYRFYCDGAMYEESVCSEEQIEKLSFRICHTVFTESSSHRITTLNGKKEKSQRINIIYTLNPSKVFSYCADSMLRSGGIVNLVVPEQIAQQLKHSECDVWSMTENKTLFKSL